MIPGEILVADTTSPDWEPVMKTAAAVVTNRGGRTCHAAIVARELGIPAVVGAEHAAALRRRSVQRHAHDHRGVGGDQLLRRALARAMPKSSTHTRPSTPRRMLSGLKSR